MKATSRSDRSPGTAGSRPSKATATEASDTRNSRSSRSGSWRSSCAGSTPRRRVNQSAEPSDTRMKGLVMRLYSQNGRASSFAVRSGRAMAMFFGTSSPTTIVNTVARTSASTIETPPAAPSPIVDSSNGSSNDAATGSAMKPSTTAAMVMPSCAPESWNDN